MEENEKKPIITPGTAIVTYSLIVANILIFIGSEIVGSTEDTEVLLKVGALYLPYVREGQYWRLITSIFLHSGIQHLLNNMLLLGVLGTQFERIVGKARYLAIYLLSGLAGSGAMLVRDMVTGKNMVSMGASGAIYGVIGAIIWILILRKGHVEQLSMKQIVVMLLFSVYFGITGARIAHVAHIAGLVAGFILAVILDRKKEPDVEEKTEKDYNEL